MKIGMLLASFVWATTNVLAASSELVFKKVLVTNNGGIQEHVCEVSKIDPIEFNNVTYHTFIRGTALLDDGRQIDTQNAWTTEVLNHDSDINLASQGHVVEGTPNANHPTYRYSAFLPTESGDALEIPLLGTGTQAYQNDATIVDALVTTIDRLCGEVF